MPQANSTTSWPRATSPRASVWVLPCSALMARAISSLRASKSRRISYITLARLAGGVAAHPGKAALAAATAAATSVAPPAARFAVCSPVAGLKTGVWPVPGTDFPAMRWLIVFTVRSYHEVVPLSPFRHRTATCYAHAAGSARQTLLFSGDAMQKIGLAVLLLAASHAPALAWG